jgi:hypothetical protein
MIAPGIIKLTVPMMLVKTRQFGIVSFAVIREFRQSTLNEYNLALVIMNFSRTSRSLNLIEVCTAVENQVSRSGIVGKGLTQLLNHPDAGRMSGHIEVRNAPSVMRNDKETI